VYNGLDPAELHLPRPQEQWDLFLGKLHSDRGYQWAVDAVEAHGAAADHRGRLAPDVYGRHQVRRRSRWERKAVLLARAQLPLDAGAVG